MCLFLLHRPRPTLILLIGALLWSLSATAAVADPESVEVPLGWDAWYRVDVSGQRAGWMHLSESSENERFVTTSELVLELRRGDSVQRVEMASRFVEGGDGQPVSAWSKQVLGERPVETRYVYSDSGIEVETRHGDDFRQQRLPLPEGPWVAPGQAQRQVEEYLRAGAESFTLRTVDPQLGTQPMEMRWQLVERRRSVATGGGSVQTSRWRQTQSLAPQLATLVDLDATGRLVRSSVEMMGLEMTMTRTSKAQARAEAVAPEILIQTFLRPNRPIERPRAVRRGIYDLRFGRSSSGVAEGSPETFQLPTSSHQQSELRGDTLRVVVDLSAEVSARQQGPIDAPTVAPYLSASTYLNYEDPVLRRLRLDALADASSSPRQRAEILRRFVATYLTDKNLASVLATASEVAARRSGDCTEHSVLLAALLRGDGIPSRVAAGWVYIDRFVGQEDVFGYHMWTQALIAGRWVDLDATLGADVPFDGTHIMLATSALDDDKMALMELARVAPWVGQAEINVIEVSYGEEEP